MSKPWRPKNWVRIFNAKLQEYGGVYSGRELDIAEVGADAEWEAIKDYICELNKDAGKDDKLFRLKLFQWLGG